jgi:hypothetical protein
MATVAMVAGPAATALIIQDGPNRAHNPETRVEDMGASIVDAVVMVFSPHVPGQKKGRFPRFRENGA